MADEDENDQGQDSRAGKMRPLRSQAGRRNKPYQRPGSSGQSMGQAPKGVLNRVADYVPTWLSSWFSSSSGRSNSSGPEDGPVASASNGPSYSSPVSPLREEGNSWQTSSYPLPDATASQARGRADSGALPSILPSGIKKRKLGGVGDDAEARSLETAESDNREADLNPGHDAASDPGPEAGSTKAVVPKLASPLARRIEPLAKPAFKVSSFLSSPTRSAYSPLPSKHVSNSSLDTSSFSFSSSRSAFYVGQTCFGGMSSFRERDSKRVKLSPVSHGARTVRTQIRAKPLQETPRTAVTSETAKKILSSLEEMATPLSDAFKRPPLLEGTTSMTDRLRSNSVAKSERLNQPPVKNLGVPAAATLFSSDAPTRLKSTPSMPPASSTATALSDTPSRARLTFPATSKPVDLPVPVAPVVREGSIQTESVFGKIRREKERSHYTKACEEEVVNSLPNIVAPAPLAMSSLPKFDFVASTACKPAPVVSPVLTVSKPSQVGEIKAVGTSTPLPAVKLQSVALSKTSEVGEFRFARPGVIADTTLLDTPNQKSFQFRSPLALGSSSAEVESSEVACAVANQKPEVIKSQNASSAVESVAVHSYAPALSITSSRSDGTSTFLGTAAAFLNKSEKPVETWLCCSCKTANKIELSKCSDCGLAKGTTQPGLSLALGNDAKPLLKLNLPAKLAGSWECPTCMISNKPDQTVCVACLTRKPGANADVARSLAAEKPVVEAPAAFKLKFAKPVGSWDCSTCMITNGPGSDSCPACGTAKPGGRESIQTEIKPLPKLNLPTKPPGSWTCAVCLIVNDREKTECAACQSPNPIAAVEKPGGVSKASLATTGHAASIFATFSASGDSKLDFARESAPTGVKFGSVQPISSSGFTFGLPTGFADKSANSGFKFGSAFSQPADYTFGSPSRFPSFEFGKSDSKLGVQAEAKSTAAVSTAAPSFSFASSSSVDAYSSSAGGFSSSVPSSSNKSSVISGESIPVRESSFSTIADAARAGFLKVPSTSTSLNQDEIVVSKHVSNGLSSASSAYQSREANTVESFGVKFEQKVFGSSAATGFAFGGSVVNGSIFGLPYSSSSGSSMKPVSEGTAGVAGEASAASSIFTTPASTFATSASSLFSFAPAVSTSGFSFAAPTTGDSGSTKPAALFGQGGVAAPLKSLFSFAPAPSSSFPSEVQTSVLASSAPPPGLFGSFSAPSQATFSFGNTKVGGSGPASMFQSSSVVASTSSVLSVPAAFNFSSSTGTASFLNGPSTVSKAFEFPSSKSTGFDTTNNNVAMVQPSFGFPAGQQGLFSLGANPSENHSGRSTSGKREILKAHRRNKR